MIEAVLTFADISRMLDAGKSAEEKALISIAWEIGASLRTIVALRVRDFQSTGSRFSVSLGGSEKRTYPFDFGETSKCFRTYLKEYRGRTSALLFPVRGRKPEVTTKQAHQRRLQRLVEQAGNRIGIRKLTLHKIRRARAFTLIHCLRPSELAERFEISLTAAKDYYKNFPFDPLSKSMAQIFFGLRPLPDGKCGYTPDMVNVRNVLLETGHWKEKELDPILLSETAEGTHLRRLLHAAWEIDEGPLSLGNHKIPHPLLEHIIWHPSICKLIEGIQKIVEAMAAEEKQRIRSK